MKATIVNLAILGCTLYVMQPMVVMAGEETINEIPEEIHQQEEIESEEVENEGIEETNSSKKGAPKVKSPLAGFDMAGIGSAMQALSGMGTAEMLKNFIQSGSVKDMFNKKADLTNGILNLAQEYMGVHVSDEQMQQLRKVMGQVQKNVHNHYLMNKDASGAHRSSILKRVVEQRSKSSLVKSLKELSPDLEEGELLENLDVAMGMVDAISHGENRPLNEVMDSVMSSFGLELNTDEMNEVKKHMGWAQDLLSTLFQSFQEDAAQSDEL